MNHFTAIVQWARNGVMFTDSRYSRAHRWRFDGGVDVPASSSPHIVRIPYSNPSAVDPEEAFVASISSCHMLWFLSLAAKKGWVVDSYTDEAVGVLEKNEAGKLAVTRVTLRPLIAFAGTAPGVAEFNAVHHDAHVECFIANSIRTTIQIESRIAESVLAEE